MADIDKEVFDNGDEVAIKKVKKPRKPMSASKKLAFALRMKASREAKKKAKEKPVDELKEKLLPKEPAKQPNKEEPVEKIKKPRRNIRHVPDELDSHLVIINSLKADIAEMKLHQNSKKDLEEIKQLKSELKAIRSQKKKEQKTKDIVVKVKEEVKEDFVKEEPVQPVQTPLPSVPIDIPKPRYSTYKKSIWSKLL
tara:strand:+ start:40 stop:627 length:588 start_codon:yes stop_codon:yes gene_type:complete